MQRNCPHWHYLIAALAASRLLRPHFSKTFCSISPLTPPTRLRSRALRETASLAHLMVTQGYVSGTARHPTISQHTSIARPNLATRFNHRRASGPSNSHADVTVCLREPRKLTVPELRHRGHDGNTQVPGPTKSSDLTLVRPFQIKTFSDRHPL